ncbi:MAG: hypothetical protein ACI9R3_006478 [Verrucomicrobiales bacterium]|jgi:hypothetical protein
MVDAKPTQLSPFVENGASMQQQKTGPFQMVWTSAPRQELMQSSQRQEIFIAPVETRYLRPIRQALARKEMSMFGTERPVEVLATDLRTAFTNAFQDSPEARYRVVPRPTPDSVTLKLCLVELDPTNAKGNVAKKAAGFVVGPVAGLAGRWTKGSVAIEGKLEDTRTGWLLLEFADREQDKMTFWNKRDFQPYGHCRITFNEWGSQFERLTRTPDWQSEIKDASVFTLSPF